MEETSFKQPACPRITWMKTFLDELKSRMLTLTDAVNMAQNHPLWRLLVNDKFLK